MVLDAGAQKYSGMPPEMLDPDKPKPVDSNGLPIVSGLTGNLPTAGGALPKLPALDGLTGGKLPE